MNQRRKIKLLYIVTRMIKGGASNVVLSLSNGLDPKSFDITIATGISEPIPGPANKITVFPSLVREIRPLKDLMALLKLYLFIKKSGFDIVHTHTSKAGIIGRLAARLAAVPVIIHSPHGHIFAPNSNIPNVPKNTFLLRCLLFIERVSALFTTRIITPTGIEKKEELSLGIGRPNQFRVIHNGIDIDRFEKRVIDAPAKRAELGLNSSHKVICTIARLSEEKGILYLIDALETVAKEIPSVKLVLVGEGPLRKTIEQKAKDKGILSDIIFLPAQEDIAAVLAVSDLFVLPSLYEAFGLVLVEAMVMKKPVISTRTGGIPEVIEHGKTGILVNPADSQTLAQAITAVLQNQPLRESLARNAYHYAKEHFDVKQMVALTENLYHQTYPI